MLDSREIDIEIAKWEYLDSSYDNYAKLADLYTIRDHMNNTAPAQYEAEYSAAPSEIVVDQYGDSDFLRAIAGREPAEMWRVMDGLMDTLKIANPRVYSNVMRKIDNG